ncbi:unnamed protein product [Rhizoctonia solani]|uniref:Carboxypeptidase n=1 Tax=Rhizoctonia solani TaxID=456999 RepID=A0A8H3DYL0_9AGAM|nr:unnamed protein product [Rhizoctonia solani]
MKSISLLGLIPLVSLVLTREFPELNGVIGGAPKDIILRSKVAVATPATISTGKLRYVENSGVCKTTPKVYQASGYADLALNQSMWFWFFAARNNADTAPLSLTLWPGGPGSSGMMGVFRAMGPCRINQDETTVSRNPYSWNEYSNIQLERDIHMDAAIVLWKMLQIWFADSQFSKYATRDFAIWTESYGGHYGPVFASYFLDQHTAIAAGKIKGVKINLKVLSIGNGLTDPRSQYTGYVKYAMSNPYHPLVNESTIKSVNNTLYKPGGCMDQIDECNLNLNDTRCSMAQNYCNENMLALLVGDYDFYDARVKKPSLYPYNITKLLTNSSFVAQIGAGGNWTMTNYQVYGNFVTTGDWMKNSRLDLEKVINAGVRTLILVGDADFICNHIGVEAMVNALQTKFTSEYKKQNWVSWTVAGTVAGKYKNAGTFSYLRVYQAGHEVPAYGNGELEVGQAALVYFTQFM